MCFKMFYCTLSDFRKKNISKLVAVWAHVRRKQMEAIYGRDGQQHRYIYRHTGVRGYRRQVSVNVIHTLWHYAK